MSSEMPVWIDDVRRIEILLTMYREGKKTHWVDVKGVKGLPEDFEALWEEDTLPILKEACVSEPRYRLKDDVMRVFDTLGVETSEEEL